MASGALYRSTVTGRVLHSSIDTSLVSPTLSKTGRPPQAEEWEKMLHPNKPQIGRFSFAPVVPPALEPLAKTRDMNYSSALTATAGPSTSSIYTKEPANASMHYDNEKSESASAGSFHPQGPALTDPDGISNAVTTMRNFRGLIERMGGKPIAKEPEQQVKPKTLGSPEDPLGGANSMHSSISSPSKRAMLMDAESVATSLPLVPSAPPSVAAAVAASASGTAVVGTLSVLRDHLMRATMIASKWTRIITTEYGTNKNDPCRLVVEMQQQYYTSFLNDMYDATGGDFTFDTEPAPTAIKANIGALNMMIAQGGTDFEEHLLPQHVSNKKRRFRVIEPPKEVTNDTLRDLRSLGLSAFDAENPGIIGDGKSGNQIMIYGGDPSDPSFARAAAEAAEKYEARFSAPIEFKGMAGISRSDAQIAEFIKVKKQTEVRAGRLLRLAAQTGDAKTIARLIIRGEPVYMDPRPWYERDVTIRESAEGDTADTNPHVVKTDQIIKPKVDWCERDGETALMHAVRCAQVEPVRSLLQMGANPNKKNAAGKTAIDIGYETVERISTDLKNRVPGSLLQRKQIAEVMKLLDVRTFMQIVQAKDVVRAKYMIDNENADVNETNAYGMTPLHLAVLNADSAMAELLVKNGANPIARNNIGQTPQSLIDDLLKKRDRDSMRKAFDNGATEDEERRKLLRARAEKFTREKEELLKFEKQLRTLTRGTAAAKTLQKLTTSIHSTVRAQSAQRHRAANHNNNTSSASNTSKSASMTSTQRAARDLMSPRRAATVHTAAPAPDPMANNPFLHSATIRPGQIVIGGSTHGSTALRKREHSLPPPASPTKAIVGTLYDDSHSRHMRDFVAVSMKEEQAARARTPVGTRSLASTGNVMDDLTYKQFFNATAPPPLDRRFDVWFKSHVSSKSVSKM